MSNPNPHSDEVQNWQRKIMRLCGVEAKEWCRFQIGIDYQNNLHQLVVTVPLTPEAIEALNEQASVLQ